MATIKELLSADAIAEIKKSTADVTVRPVEGIVPEQCRVFQATAHAEIDGFRVRPGTFAILQNGKLLGFSTGATHVMNSVVTVAIYAKTSDKKWGKFIYNDREVPVFVMTRALLENLKEKEKETKTA